MTRIYKCAFTTTPNLIFWISFVFFCSVSTSEREKDSNDLSRLVVCLKMGRRVELLNLFLSIL